MSRIAEKIYALPSFQKQIQRLLMESAIRNFPKLEIYASFDEESELNWNNILSCASILLQSNSIEHQDIALRIAQHCLITDETNVIQKSAAIVLLEGLTNKPAIALAVRRQLINTDYQNDLPLPIKMEIIARNIEHALLNEDGSVDFLNKFQKQVYDSYKVTQAISISAPTSAGKSYILERILLEEITKSEYARSIVFVVPTRALINQVEQEINDIIIENEVTNVFISTVPQLPDSSSLSQHKIFVFTQERLHWFRSEIPDFKIDFLIIDEAHKIGDGSRGILLQQKIEDLVNDFPDLKIFFSSPFTANPEIFLEDLPEATSKHPIKTEFVSVNQNIIHVSQKRSKPLEWEIILKTTNNGFKLGEILLANRPTPESKRLLFIVNGLADPNGGNLIYANGPADAEKYAQILYDVVPDNYSQISEEVGELIKLTKKAVHDKFLLANVLKKKIAFHYGNMPVLIRSEIERLFKTGDIHFIICTSTLLEGVNLPAKSIFIRKPTRGSGNPMDDSDFWNLAGRAGRWGKEFSGNIVCVEPHVWARQPSIDRTKQNITKAVSKILEQKQDLLQYLQDGTPRSNEKKFLNLEFAVTYFYTKFLQGTLADNTEAGQLLKQEFDKISKRITIPNDIVIRNIGISPLAQQNLYDFFAGYTGEFADLIPVLPESDNSVESYKNIVEHINTYLSGDPVGLAIYQAILIINWMRGYPLPLLIDRSYNYFKERAPKPYATVIRDVMKDIEEFARFKFAKFSSCYIDVLRFFLGQKGQNKLLQEIPQLNIWLEFGVSQQTQISLIGLGLSRNTSITISEYIANDKYDREQCLRWLQSHDIDTFPISPIMIREVERVLERQPA